jgi:hypothetical protein
MKSPELFCGNAKIRAVLRGIRLVRWFSWSDGSRLRQKLARERKWLSSLPTKRSDAQNSLTTFLPLRASVGESSTTLINALFQKLSVVYLRKFQESMDGVPLDAVKQEWAGELGEFTRPQIVAALAKLKVRYPTWPPTLYEFRNLCVEARSVQRDNTLKLAPPRQTMPQELRDRLRAIVGSMNITPTRTKHE